MLRILIADAEKHVRQSVREVIEMGPRWEVCGEAADGEAALAIIARETPNVAILAVELPRLDGLSLTRWIMRECPSTNPLLFTRYSDDKTIRGALAAGARGYVLKTESACALRPPSPSAGPIGPTTHHVSMSSCSKQGSTTASVRRA
jgi:DNA-binding NarL/FixJ family response regulator